MLLAEQHDEKVDGDKNELNAARLEKRGHIVEIIVVAEAPEVCILVLIEARVVAAAVATFAVATEYSRGDSRQIYTRNERRDRRRNRCC